MVTCEKIVLSNGLRVLLVPKSDSLATTMLVLVEAGSKYETKNLNGLSHFLEHMCFKGTKRRPRPIDITNELNNIGAVYNAFTGQEYTGYYAKARNSDLDIVLDVLADMYVNPVFDEQEIEKEKGVIIEEINLRQEDMPQGKVQILFSKLLYGDQPAGWPVGGEKEFIRNMTRADFIKYRAEHYLAGATTIVIAGGFDGQELAQKIERNFGGIMTGIKKDKEKTRETQTEPAIVLGKKETDQSHLVLGVRAYNLFDERRFALELLAEILGGGMGTRLFERLRTDMGVAYYIDADAETATDHGVLAASAGVDSKRLKDVVAAILDEFGKLKHMPVPEDELQRVKNRVTAGLVLGLETSNSLAMFYGGEEILEKSIMSPEELTRRFEAVTAEEIRAVANDIFKNDKLNLAVVGPSDDPQPLRDILVI